MRKVSVNRLRAKVRKYKISKTQAKASMVEGNINSYISDLLALYQSKNQLAQVAIPVKTNKF